MSKGSGGTKASSSNTPNGVQGQTNIQQSASLSGQIAQQLQSRVKVEDTTWLGTAPAIRVSFNNMVVTATQTPEGKYLPSEIYSESGKWQELPEKSFTRDGLKKYAIDVFSKWMAEDELERRRNR